MAKVNSNYRSDDSFRKIAMWIGAALVAIVLGAYLMHGGAPSEAAPAPRPTTIIY